MMRRANNNIFGQCTSLIRYHEIISCTMNNIIVIVRRQIALYSITPSLFVHHIILRPDIALCPDTITDNTLFSTGTVQ